MDRGVYNPWCHKESDTTEQLNAHSFVEGRGSQTGQYINKLGDFRYCSDQNYQRNKTG